MAFQMACLCDLRVAEVDSLLGMHEAGAPIHPKVQTVFRYYRLSPEILNDLIEHKKSISVQQAHRSTWLNELTRVGCARGRSIELAKSLTKFPQSALLMDRGHIWKSVLEHHDTSSLQLDLIPEDQLWSEMKRGADRFLIDKIGRHASSKLHTLQEIYDSIRPNVFDESRLMTDLKSKRGK